MPPNIPQPNGDAHHGHAGRIRQISIGDLDFGTGSKKKSYGGFGEVVKAKLDTTSDVAVKKIKYRNPTEREKSQTMREIDAMSRIPNHPSIITFYGYCTDKPDELWIVMEWMQGDIRSRDEQVEKSPKKALDIAQSVAAGLQHMHNQNMIHRDIKPANILHKGAQYKIADFGFAREMADAATIVVTDKYRAPEMSRYGEKGKQTSKVDIFSFGRLLEDLETWAKQEKLFGDLVDRCTHNDPLKRPTAEECVKEIQQLRKVFGKESGAKNKDKPELPKSAAGTKPNDIDIRKETLAEPKKPGKAENAKTRAKTSAKIPAAGIPKATNGKDPIKKPVAARAMAAVKQNAYAKTPANTRPKDKKTGVTGEKGQKRVTFKVSCTATTAESEDGEEEGDSDYEWDSLDEEEEWQGDSDSPGEDYDSSDMDSSEYSNSDDDSGESEDEAYSARGAKPNVNTTRKPNVPNVLKNRKANVASGKAEKLPANKKTRR